MTSQRILLIITIILAIISIVLAGLYVSAYMQAQDLQKQSTGVSYNVNVLDFTKLFITKVIKSEKEVSYEDRLSLQNLVSNINDNDISSAWVAFSGAKTQSEIQTATKNLLGIIVSKISY